MSPLHAEHRPSGVRDDQGFTMIEVIIAMFIAVIVIGALAVGFVGASDGVTSAQTETQLIAVADQHIEQIRQLVDADGFDALALTSNPAGPEPSTLPADPSDPDDYVTGWSSTYPAATWTPSSATVEGYLIESNFNNSALGTIDGGTTFSEPLLVNGAWNYTSGTTTSEGQVPQTFTVTLPSGEVVTGHVYITATTVPCAATGTLLGTSCTGDARRLIVAVQDQSPAGRTDVPTAPEYTSTIIVRGEPANQQNLSNGLEVGVGVS
jgi:prepilin-type N-terminal cleavage/methylation domain-containing protein